MPIYEYICLACHKKFEILQGIHDAPQKRCPSCKKLKAKKIVSQSGFQLKGSGWFSDGYSKEKPAAKTEAPATPAKADNKTKTQ